MSDSHDGAIIIATTDHEDETARTTTTTTTTTLTLSMLVEMGFAEAKARRALQVNGGNMDQALADLTSGAPLDVVPQQATATAAGNVGRQQRLDGGLHSLSVPPRQSSFRNNHGASANNGNGGQRKRQRQRPAQENDNGLVVQQQQQPVSMIRTSNRNNVPTSSLSSRIGQYDATTATAAARSSPTRRSRQPACDETVRARASWMVGSNPRTASNRNGMSGSDQECEVESTTGFSELQPLTTDGEQSTVSRRRNASRNSSARLDHDGPLASNSRRLVDQDAAATSAGPIVDDAERSWSNPVLSNQDDLPDPGVSSLNTERVGEDEAADEVEYCTDPVSAPRNEGGASSSTSGSSWWEVRFLVLLSVVLVIPAVVVLLAFLLPRELAPEPIYKPRNQSLFELLNGLLPPDGQLALATPETPQNRAYNWLLTDKNYTKYGDKQKVQRYVLATIYFSTNGDEWIVNDGWLDSTSECSWFHQYSTEFCRSGAVIDLNLSRNNLAGSVPNEITLLESLKALSLDDNVLSSTIPSDIGNLRNLVSLDLSRNEMTGTVPSRIADMAKLEFLYLNDNALTGSFTCPSFIKYCYISCSFNDDDRCRSLQNERVNV